MSKLTGSNHRCSAQFKCAQTVVGQRFAGNGPNGLSSNITITTTIFIVILVTTYLRQHNDSVSDLKAL